MGQARGWLRSIPKLSAAGRGRGLRSQEPDAIVLQIGNVERSAWCRWRRPTGNSVERWPQDRRRRRSPRRPCRRSPSRRPRNRHESFAGVRYRRQTHRPLRRRRCRAECSTRPGAERAPAGDQIETLHARSVLLGEEQMARAVERQSMRPREDFRPAWRPRLPRSSNEYCRRPSLRYKCCPTHPPLPQPEQSAD